MSMESSFWFVINFKDEKALLKADSNMSFDKLMAFISGKWSCLSSNSFVCHCVVSNLSNLVLNNVEDYMNIVDLSTQMSLRTVECVVTVPNERIKPVQHNIARHNNARQPEVLSDSFSSQGIDSGNQIDSSEYSGLMRPPAYNICPEINQQSLLSRDWKDCITGEGQVFRTGRAQFRTALVKYSTAHGFCYDYAKNNSAYVNVNCREKASGCPWFIRGKECSGTGVFVIGKCNLVHTCVGNIVRGDSKRLGPKIWGTMIVENVKCKMEHPSVEIRNHMKTSYGVDVKYAKVWRSVQSAKGVIYGTYNESFQNLKKYAGATVETNPGSVAFVEADERTKRFKRSFFAWAACLEGFKDCRPMISVDGTHMYGRWKGVILSATAKDGNNGLFPVAIALVTAETLDNWVWFLEQLKGLLKHNKPIFWLSDRNTGLMSAFPMVFEEPANFYCLYHLHNNLRTYYSGPWSTEHRDTMCSLLTECAYAPNVRCFNESIEKFKLRGKGLADKFLENLDPKHWAYAFAPNIKRYGEMTSNASESFNNWIKIARGLPVTQMVETIRADIMRWFVERRADSDRWCSLLCVRRQHIWNFYVEASRTWNIAQCPDGSYIVHSSPSVVVKLTAQTCTCSQWQIHGFPCIHATAVIMKYETSIDNHIDKCFYKETYKKAYGSDLNPVPGTAILEQLDDETEELIEPPATNNPPGRPKNKRKKSYGEVPKRKMTICSKCGQKSRHDALTCPLQ